jgi:succinate dehydrogenase flavin-adding protein (antitoxin of CptAB toxin-antitoxin module)
MSCQQALLMNYEEDKFKRYTRGMTELPAILEQFSAGELKMLQSSNVEVWVGVVKGA